MKKLILVLSFIIGVGFMACAQVSNKSPEQRAAHHTKELQKRLNLSQAQASEINTAFLTMATRMDSLKSTLSSDKKKSSWLPSVSGLKQKNR
jgi:uncharacterized protein HemX